MGLKCGIVGLPNVGKSTLFNALTQAGALAANYPFATKEPNVGMITVPDERLQVLADIVSTKKIIPTTVEIVDIAGLIKGASKGEGLGNQFLANIREVDAIIHVIRCFEDDNVVHVDGGIDPLRDKETIDFELIMKDLEILEKRIEKLKKQAKTGKKEDVRAVELAQELYDHLENGQPARSFAWSEAHQKQLEELQLLTQKPTMYVLNVSESDVTDGNTHTQKVGQVIHDENADFLLVSAAIEADISEFETIEEKLEFLEEMGLNEPGVHRVTREAYKLLKLITYFTAGEKEVRAWTVSDGATAPEAAGVIHTDFQDGFIRAEVIKYADYAELGSEAAVKEAGKMSLEGKEYIVKDGDVIHFRFNV